MESKDLCPECRVLGYCFFEYLANKQALTADGSFDKAAKINQEIAERRVAARALGCPNINEVNPDYPGKNQL